MSTWQKVIAIELVVLAILIGTVLGYWSRDAAAETQWDSPLPAGEPCVSYVEEHRVYMPQLEGH